MWGLVILRTCINFVRQKPSLNTGCEAIGIFGSELDLVTS